MAKKLAARKVIAPQEGTLMKSERRDSMQTMLQSLGASNLLKEQSKALSKKISSRGNDSWMNAITGLGVNGKDKRNAGVALYPGTLREVDAEQIYAADPLARRVVNMLPDDMTREWIEWKDKADEKGGLDEEFQRLDVRAKFNEATRFARLYGGAGLFVNTGEPVENLINPLDENNVRRIESLTVLTRWELWALATDIERNVTKPNFGKPKRYWLQPRSAYGMGAQIPIDHSRIIRFDGIMLPRLLHIQNNFWDDSVLTAIYESLRDYNMAYAGGAALAAEFRLIIYQIEGLANAIASGDDAILAKRFQAMDLVKSIMNAILLDKEETMTSETPRLMQYPELLQKIKERFQASTDTPATILFNESPAGGLNGAGGHELANWFNFVGSQQKTYLKPRIDRLITLLQKSKQGPTRGKDETGDQFTFKPLFQLTDQEKADTRLKNVQADEIEMNTGVVESSEVRLERHPDYDQNKIIERPNDLQAQNPDDENASEGEGPEAVGKGERDKAKKTPKA